MQDKGKAPNTWSQKSPSVSEALLPGMPITALIRNLGRLSSIDVIKAFTDTERLVVEKLTNEEQIKRSRVHPYQILVALRVYASGAGFRGSMTWKPSMKVMDALNDAFYMAFKNVVPAGKRTLIGLDVSGSMGWNHIGEIVTAREAAAAMCMVTAAAEPQCEVVAFSHGLVNFPISKYSRLNDVVESTSRIPFGRTDCALPMLAAMSDGLDVDTFVIYTDNETWHGSVHPYQALNQYRQKTGIAAKLIVVGMTATQFSIADPKDPGMMDVVGFDASAPAAISSFSGKEMISA